MSGVSFDVWMAQIDLKLSGSVREGLYIFGALVLVTVPIVIWAAFYRKKPRRRVYRHHHRSHHHDHNSAETPPLTTSGSSAESAPLIRKRKGWRRSRHRERPMNPTLAQTRGLPPVRNESTPPAGL